VRLELAKQGDADQLKLALQELRESTQKHPDHWPSWLNLGQALKQSRAKPEALKALQQALKLAKTPEEKWQTEAAIAELEGKPAPPPPAEMGQASAMPEGDNPHGGMAPSGGNPHEGLGIPPP
jgi:tetratricopeptide (TPR) repeat protein